MQTPPNNEPNWIAGVKPPDDVITKSMIEIFEMECREQPERLAGLFRSYQHEPLIEAGLQKLHHVARHSGPILFIGMGASYCSSIAGSVWLQSCGRSSFFADAGEWLHYSLPVWDQVAGTILTTASGESAELVELCRKTPQKPLTLVCNNPASACWRLVPDRLPMLAGPEYGNATKTYTNATAACILAACASSGRSWQGDHSQILDAYTSSLQRIFSLRTELEKFCRGAANIELVGRGSAYGSAIMGSLCIREMAGKRAAAHTGAGFRHGPILDVNDSHLAIIFALGHTAELGVGLAQDCNARGGKVVLVSTGEQPSSDKLFSVILDAVPEPWESLTSVLVPQALTLRMIELYGANLKPRFQYGLMKE